MPRLDLLSLRLSLRASIPSPSQGLVSCISVTRLRFSLPTRRIFRRPASTTTISSSRRGDQTFQLPAQILIYHAGAGRTTFLAMVRLSSLVVAVFFIFLIAPAYVRADKDIASTAAIVAGGIVPLTLVTLTASPFVTHMYINLPDAARASRHALERFVANLPASTPLTLTTMNFVAVPRYTHLRAVDLRPAVGTRLSRFGLVNYVRRRDSPRPSFRNVNGFFVQPRHPVKPRAPVDPRRDFVEGWIWEAVRQRIERGNAVKS
ncbi:hypothetical protein XA68_18559 [Ophiocordyceps unilateralis]|uniref:Uncharacterized protein n=1 Tax=Ophiocordyceps unilateralis TaxID=268505 RepID=A0A2A9P1L2_OPHUN|nr:hypothetical protein XA68_18559 [Ophiocordyceps unilateralis]